MKSFQLHLIAATIACSGIGLTLDNVQAAPAQEPLFLGSSAPPLMMMVMARDHKLYYEAYNDASDLDGDGQLNIGYNPSTTFKYFGYFDSGKCYSHDGNKFVPQYTTTDKRCTTNTGEWSGDFLNYITTSRMDAMRKVLYGGYRSTDSATETVLERAFIPQDAHAWGKEYASVANDGYNIADYTPLPLPETGKRHLFANVTLRGTTTPLMRVLNNSSYRVWEWVSIEQPVAGTKCMHGSSGPDCASGSTQYTSYPNDSGEYDALVTEFANAGHLQCTVTRTQINGNTNPCTGAASDYYLSIFTGTLTVNTGGTYQFEVDGDDAVQVFVDGTLVAAWYGGHGTCSTGNSACGDTSHRGSITLTAGTHTIVFRHQEATGGDSWYLRWNGPDSSNNWQIVPTSKFSGLSQSFYNVQRTSSSITDYSARVKVCVSGLLESDCQGYPAGSTPTVHKPTGLLHEFGEPDNMMFGLLTGSYTKNTSGGVLRKNISSFTNEINTATGQFLLKSSGNEGIVNTIDRLKITGFAVNNDNYNYSCGWITTRAINEGECKMWGNPLAEMLYETVRYFAQTQTNTSDGTPTSAFTYTNTSGDDFDLGLPLASWKNPYRTAANGGYGSCAKPFSLLLSDINPSYDSDQLPGSYFGTFTGSLTAQDGTALNVSTEATTIWNNETEATNVFIGQSGTNYDGAPTAKTVSSFSNIRGLAPEEPTKQGSYYTASVAQFAHNHDLNLASGSQKLQTFSVALASPLPRIEIPVGTSKITLVPFAKSVGGSSINAASGQFQPTNQIVDFYVDTIKNTNAGNQDATVNSGRAYYKFRINYEDVEQGADHDMDAIALYEISLNADLSSITVKVDSNYAAGGIAQHMGYVISGTNSDGVYLVVRDCDTANSGGGSPCISSGSNPGTDPDYYLDTPNTANTALPLTSTRTFSAGTASASFIKHDPLWYAAKWGGFEDVDNNNTISNTSEWDADGDGNPDNYFLVTNAGELKDQLRSAFNEIISRTTSASSIAQNSTRLDTDTMIYQARFNTADWSGQLLAYRVNSDGTVGALQWDAATLVPDYDDRNIFTWRDDTRVGTPFTFTSATDTSLTTTQKSYLGSTDTERVNMINYLRGDDTNEQRNGGGFRNRSTPLGDIVNSDPLFVWAEDFGYDNLSESQPATAGDPNVYQTFVGNKASRTKMVYVGANDGMLHGINADTGVEQFAYVPATAIQNMPNLAQTSYNGNHRYLVDGPTYFSDAYVGSTWKTVLLGSMGGGGKAVFALDISSPTAFDSSKVMWEFTHANDLGYVLGPPVIGRMANGRWAAIFGNGYDSTNGLAKLFIVYLNPNLSDGWTLNTDYCILTTDSTASNGLSAPATVINGDRVVQAIYAGDKQGNLWKFNVSASSGNCPNGWDVAYKQGSTPKPLFTARNASGEVQPITAPLEIGDAPADQGFDSTDYMIYFGTGKYYETTDASSTTVQSFYGILDDGTRITATDRSTLQAQSITSEFPYTFTRSNGDGTTTSFTEDVRTTSSNAVVWTGGSAKRGWYMDLKKPVSSGSPPTTTYVAQGERVVSQALLRAGRIIFASLIPSTDVCEFGGGSWLMEIDALTGGTPDNGSFDLNNDGVINDQDNVNDQVITGIKSSEGIIKTPAVISAGGLEYKLSSGTTGNIERVVERGSNAFPRTSWRQIQ